MVVKWGYRCFFVVVVLVVIWSHFCSAYHNIQRFLFWSRMMFFCFFFSNSKLYNWQSRNFSVGLEVRREMELIFTHQAWHLKELGTDFHTHTHPLSLSPAFATLCLQRWTLVGIKPALSRAALPSRCSRTLIGCPWGVSAQRQTLYSHW